MPGLAMSRSLGD
jgi:serine/threonine protein phosphatase PrpC